MRRHPDIFCRPKLIGTVDSSRARKPVTKCFSSTVDRCIVAFGESNRPRQTQCDERTRAVLGRGPLFSAQVRQAAASPSAIEEFMLTVAANVRRMRHVDRAKCSVQQLFWGEGL